MTALADRVATPVERAEFDDLVTLVTQAPPWEKDRAAGVRILLRAVGEGKANAPEQILARWTWGSRARRARRRTAARARSTRRRSGCSAPSPTRAAIGTRRTSAKLVHVAMALPLARRRGAARVGGGLHAARQRPARRAREELGTIDEIANALAENLPAPKAPARKSRRRRKKKRRRRRRGTAQNGAERRRRCASGRRRCNAGRGPCESRWGCCRSGAHARDSRPGACPRRATRTGRDRGLAGRRPPARARVRRSGRSGRSLAAFALPQESRELGCKGLTRRQLSLLDQLVDRVGSALQLLDVSGGLGVRGDRFRDLVGVGASASASSVTSIGVPIRSPSRSQSARAARGLGASET